MGKSIKLKNEHYIDGTGVMHKQDNLRFITSTDILYDNSTGSTSSISLTEDANNYQFLLIELLAKRYSALLTTDYMFIIPKNSSFGKSIAWFDKGNNRAYSLYFKISISGKTITITDNQGGSTDANSSYWGDANVYAITKVIGINKIIDA